MRTCSRRRDELATAAVAGLSGDDECLSFWTPLTVRRGDANGEGFKDVGTWHAVVPSGR
jgi:hypothetical protein